MHAALGLEPAVGAFARDLDDRRLDPRLLAGALLDPLGLVAALLRPADVHAEQHLGPVLRFGASGTGMDLEEAVVAVRLARQQALQLAPLRFVAGCGKRGLRLAVEPPRPTLPRQARRVRGRPPAPAPTAGRWQPPHRGGCAPASPRGRARHRPRGRGPRPRGSAPPDGCGCRRGQRCLLSSVSDCLMSSARDRISARIEGPSGGRSIYGA